MPLGSVELVNASLQKYNKSTSGTIALGKICIRDLSLNPDGWKVADSSGAPGPFVVAVNDLAAAADLYFTGAGKGTIAHIKAGGSIEPGAPVKTNSSGDAITADLTGTAPDSFSSIVGTYLSKEGTDEATAATTNDVIRVKLGGASV